MLKFGEDEKERIILMKFTSFHQNYSLLVRGPSMTTVIYQAKLIQIDSHYVWFKFISDARASRDA